VVQLLRFVITPQRVMVQRRAYGTPTNSCVQLPSTALPTDLMTRVRRPLSLRSIPCAHGFGDLWQNHHRACAYQSGLQSP